MSKDLAHNTPASEALPQHDEMSVTDGQYARVCRFLFEEADLLDRRKYLDWIGLLTEDISYRVRAGATATTNAEPYQFAIFDDGAADLMARAQQLSDPSLTHAENPAPMTRRFISNVRVGPGSAQGEFEVTSYILLYRNGGTIGEPFLYSGVRRDVLRGEGNSFRIARRDVDLDCALVTSPNISSFF